MAVGYGDPRGLKSACLRSWVHGMGLCVSDLALTHAARQSGWDLEPEGVCVDGCVLHASRRRARGGGHDQLDDATGAQEQRDLLVL
jgi:hypothetical protein